MGFTAAFAAVTAVSLMEQKKTARDTRQAQKEAGAVEGAQRADQARVARREQVREARVRQAELENAAAVGGQTTSSAAVAGASSLQSQLSSNIGSINTALSFGTARSDAEQSILDAQRKSGLQLAADTGIQIASMAK